MSIPWWQRVVFPASDIGTLYNEDNRELSEKYGKMTAPFFRVEITNKDGGLVFSQDAYNQGIDSSGWDLNGIIVNDVSWEEDIEGADALTITVNNPQNNLQNSLLFQEGNQIDLWIGYDNMRPFYMGRGIVVEVVPEFGTGSMSTLKINCYDISYFMMEEGRAEIVPEGSAWWEQRRQTSNRPAQTSLQQEQAFQQDPLDMPDRILSEEERQRVLDEVSGNPTTSSDSGGQNESLSQDLDLLQSYRFNMNSQNQTSGVDVQAYDSETAELLAHFPIIAEGEEMVSSEVASDLPLRTSRLGWQRQRFGRRSRRAGKVWRGKTDSEIVTAIYFSYGITPYVEATNERRRSSRRRNPPRRQPRPTFFNNAYRDTRDEIDAAYDQRINDAAEAQGSPIRRPSLLGGEATEQGMVLSVTEVRGDTVLLDQEGNAQNSGQDFESWFADPDNRELAEIYPVIGEIEREYEEELRSRENQTPSQRPQRQYEDRTVTQKAGTTDWDFIKELGKQHGFIQFTFYHYPTQRWIGYWGPQDNVPQYTEHTFEYNNEDQGTLEFVRPNVSAKNQSTEIDLVYVDPRNGRENRLRVSMDGVNEYSEGIRGEYGAGEVNDPIGRGPEVVLLVHGQRVRVQADRRFQNADDARRWLMAYWIANAEEYYIIEGGTVIGIPEMRAREFHNVEGIDRYSGRFFITQSRHSMQPKGAYKTTFTGRAVVGWQPDSGDEADLVTVDVADLGESQSGSDDTATPELGPS